MQPSGLAQEQPCRLQAQPQANCTLAEHRLTEHRCSKHTSQQCGTCRVWGQQPAGRALACSPGPQCTASRPRTQTSPAPSAGTRQGEGVGTTRVRAKEGGAAAAAALPERRCTLSCTPSRSAGERCCPCHHPQIIQSQSVGKGLHSCVERRSVPFSPSMQLHCLQGACRAADIGSTDLAILHAGHAVGRKLQQLPSMVVQPRVLVVLLVRLRAPELRAARGIRVNKWAQGAHGRQR